MQLTIKQEVQGNLVIAKLSNANYGYLETLSLAANAGNIPPKIKALAKDNTKCFLIALVEESAVENTFLFGGTVNSVDPNTASTGFVVVYDETNDYIVERIPTGDVKLGAG